MATSRTGTSQWKDVVAYVLKEAQRNGHTSCPWCGVEMNFNQRRTPNGAWPDHIIPHIKGGTDHPSNLIVICRRCNISKGDRAAPKNKTVMATKPLRISRQW